MILDNLRFGFVGGGNMASAIICGLLRSGVAPHLITVIERNPQAQQTLLHKACAINASPIRIMSGVNPSLSECDVLVLAVKPQQFYEMVQQIKPFIAEPLLISVAAGIRLIDLQRWFNGCTRIVRSMPNTPSLIGQGMTGLISTADLVQHDREIATALAEAIGKCIWVKDDDALDVVTAISGSGPAYVFYFIEAMQEIAQSFGLTQEQGKYLATTTFVGAANLAQASQESPDQLRRQVTSPGGTTFAALEVLNQHRVNELFKQAMLAAITRSKEMAQLFIQTTDKVPT